MRYAPDQRAAKLAKLMQIEGYENIDDLARIVLFDALSPAICMNNSCNFTCEMEPDQRAGWCEECRTNSMCAALILVGMI
jgi:hypothetical protein